MDTNDPERKAMGERFAAARTAAGLTGDEAGLALDYQSGKKVISAWENGRGFPDAMNLRRVCRLYKVSADALLWSSPAESPAGQPPLNEALMARLRRLTDDQRLALERQLEATLDMLQVPQAPPAAEPGKPRRAA